MYWDVELGIPSFVSWFLLVNELHWGSFLIPPLIPRIVSRLFPHGYILPSICLYSEHDTVTVMILARGSFLVSSSVARIPPQKKNMVEDRRLLEPGIPVGL